MSDILERAKDLRHYLAHKAEWQDESVIVQELIAEVDDLRGKYQYMVDNAASNKLGGYRELGKRAADAEAEVERLRNLPQADVAAYDLRIQLMAARIKELEAALYRKNSADLVIEDQRKRIKELKAVISEAFRELVTAGPDIGDIATMDISLAIRKLASQNKRLEAAFLEQFAQGIQAPREMAELMARDALKRIKEGGKDED